jgi:hypothetical protein
VAQVLRVFHRSARPYLDVDADSRAFADRCAAMTAVRGRRRLRAGAAWASAWVVTRLLLVWVAIGRPGTQQDVRGDLHLYDGWSRALLHGSSAAFDDARWQYPPGAALVLAVPRLLPFSYVTDFLLLTLVIDAAVACLLWRRGSRADTGAAGLRTAPGAAYWIAAVACLGPVAIARFDIVVAGATVAALLAPALAGGVLLGIGAGVKLWPALLAVLPNSRRGVSPPLARPLAVVAGVLLVTVPVLAVDPGMATAALSHQASRGLQVESLAASPFVLVHMLGLGRAAGYSYGSFQVTGSVASALALALIVVGVAAICYVGWAAWRPAVAPFLARLLPARPAAPNQNPRHCPPLATSATAVMLCLLVTYRVLSPQYLLWPIATLSVAIARGESGSRRTGRLVLGAALLSQIVYPWRYNDLLQGRPFAGAVLLSRNALLVAAAVSAVLAVRSAGRSGSTPSSGTPALTRRPASAISSPSSTARTSARAAPAETSSDSGRTVGSAASSNSTEATPSSRRDASPATARTARAGARYQG